MADSKPLFTVFTPCFNAERHISRPFNSLEKQTFRDFEWLVIDDGSTDNTPNLLADLARRASFPVRVITNETNRHLAYTCDLAAKEANGEFFLRIDSDDELYPNALEEFRSTWATTAGEKIAGVWCHVTDQHGNLIGRPFPKPISTANYFDYYFDYLLGAEKYHCHKTAVIRLYPLEREGLAFVHESFCWMEIAKTYDFIFLDKALRRYFIEPENLNSLMKSPRSRNAKVTQLMYKGWLNEYLPIIRNTPLYWYLRFHFAYAFYSLLAKEPASSFLKDIEPARSRILVLAFLPFAYSILALMKMLRRV